MRLGLDIENVYVIVNVKKKNHCIQFKNNEENFGIYRMFMYKTKLYSD